MTRRSLLKDSAKAATALYLGRVASASEGVQTKSLAAPEFKLLPLGEVMPAGWLLRQLRVQADGMSGHLDEFWPDVGANSGWLGGTGESWERGPYFLDGLLPLAYLLNDDVLKKKALRFIEWTLTNQRADGMIGPSKNDDWWPRMVMLKALAQYHEVSGDERVLPLMTKYFHYQLGEMPQRPLKSWGKYRWQDEAYVAEWLYDRTQDPMLLKLVGLLQAQGCDWKANFADFRFTTPSPRDMWGGGQTDLALRAHGVNNSQALKVAAVQYRLSGDGGERAAFWKQLGALDTYHGMPNGMFSCDEHLGGLEPQHGTELCSVVETMYSLEIVLATFGAAAVGDRIEKIAYNALPGTFTDDMWAHQYDQQSNQVQVGLLSKPWTTNGPESNLYGLEPHFGCCTANYHQGWPKLTTSLWMRSSDDGLVAAIFAPSEVKTSVRGTTVHVIEETEYPFRGAIRFAVEPERPVAFPLSFRVPAWAKDAKVRVNGKPTTMSLKPGSFARMERTWQRGDVVEIIFPMPARVSRGFHGSVAVERGPLVFSLDPGESWVKLRDRGRTADWQVFRTDEWNYALKVDESNAASLRVTEHPLPARPFARAEAAVRIDVPAKLMDKWRAIDGAAAAPPVSPVTSEHEETMLTLVPYGAAKLRVTAFPSLLS